MHSRAGKAPPNPRNQPRAGYYCAAAFAVELAGPAAVFSKAGWRRGRVTVTVVPAPGVERKRTRPLCSSTMLFTSERPRPAPRWREPLLRELEALEDRRLLFFRDAEARILDIDGDAVLLAAAGKGDRALLRREADGVRQEVINHLNEAVLVGDDRFGVLGDVHVEMHLAPRQPLAHAKLARPR